MRKVVVVTGGSRGIGAACVETLARAGWSVVFLWHQSADRAEALAQRLRAEGLDVCSLRCDVRATEEVRAAFAWILGQYRHVDALVCNAGTSLICQFQDTDEQMWDDLFEVHVKGAVRCIQAVLPDMLHRAQGRIVTVSSMWGQVGASCEVAYSAAKAALIGLTKALAKEVAPSGIQVNCVAPGVIDTDMNAELTPADLDALREEIPQGRIGAPAEVAGVVRFLLEECAAYVTGQVLGVNGGLVT